MPAEYGPYSRIFFLHKNPLLPLSQERLWVSRMIPISDYFVELQERCVGISQVNRIGSVCSSLHVIVIAPVFDVTFV